MSSAPRKRPPPLRRILSLWFPDWPIQRRQWTRPELVHRVLLVTETTRQGEVVRHRNGWAAKRGIRAGMPLSEARTFLRARDSAVIEPMSAAEDQVVLEQIAARCERFSYRIGIDAVDKQPPEGLLMEVTGVPPLFGGEQALVEELVQDLATAQHATGIAWGRSGSHDQPVGGVAHPAIAGDVGPGNHVSSRENSHWRSQWHTRPATSADAPTNGGLDARVALAETAGAAWAAARCLAGPRQPVIVPADRPAWRDRLPVTALRLDAGHVESLHRLGIGRVGQLLALDRGAVRSRLGESLLVRIDQFSGTRPEPIVPLRPQRIDVVERRLDEPIPQPEWITLLWTEQLQRLLAPLEAERLGTRRIEARFTLEDRDPLVCEVRMCEAAHDLRLWEELFRLKLETVPFDAAVTGVRLEAFEVGPVDQSQGRLFDGGSLDSARNFSRLMNRLASRLGDQAVVTPRRTADPVPEWSIRFPAVTKAMSVPAAATSAATALGDRPSLLFARPRAVDVMTVEPSSGGSDCRIAAVQWRGQRYEIARQWGPERIESGWWRSGGVRRDYYRVETGAGERLWVFRRLRDGRWFWQGRW